MVLMTEFLIGKSVRNVIVLIVVAVVFIFCMKFGTKIWIWDRFGKKQ